MLVVFCMSSSHIVDALTPMTVTSEAQAVSISRHELTAVSAVCTRHVELFDDVHFIGSLDV